MFVFRYPENLRQDFIKRCVAVGGQTVIIRNKTLYVDGVKQVEPYAIHIDPFHYIRDETAVQNNPLNACPSR